MFNSNMACVSYLKYQFNLFLLATSFFTRLPVTEYCHYSPSKMRRASQFFPLVGWFIAGILVLEFSILQPLLGLLPSLCLLLISSILLTGALHEDGLADICDGIWGGYSLERKLAIMKDSRIGTYGTCGLVLALLTKFVLWWQLAQHQHLVLALILAYPLSRALAISLVQDMKYVSNQIPCADKQNGSKSEPLVKPMTTHSLIFVLATGASACLLLPLSTIFYLFIGCISLRYLLKYWLNKHIKGYTGDALGTAQQLHELLIYFILIANLPINAGQL